MGTNSGMREMEADKVSYASWPNGVWMLSYGDATKFYAYIPTWEQVVDQDWNIIMDNVVNASATVTNGGVVLAVSCGKRVDGRLVDQEHRWHADTAGTGNYLMALTLQLKTWPSQRTSVLLL